MAHARFLHTRKNIYAHFTGLTLAPEVRFEVLKKGKSSVFNSRANQHDNQTALSIISGSKTRWRIGDFCIRVLFSESEMSKSTFQKLFSNFSNFSKITKSSTQDVPIDYELFLLSFKI